MESIVREMVEFLVRDALFSPGQSEKKRLMQLAAAGAEPRGDRVVSLLYQLVYAVLLIGSIWGSLLLPGATEPTLLGYGLCYLCGSLVLEGLLCLYSWGVQRSEWQVLASRAIKREAEGRVSCYRSVRYRWFFRFWGPIFLVFGIYCNG